MPNPRHPQVLSDSDDVQRRILEALRDLQFGSVEIQVHDSRVVRITRNESLRIEPGAVRKSK